MPFGHCASSLWAPSGSIIRGRAKGLIYRLDGDVIIYVRAGTHSELFED
ncbi:MAG: hypothetical protein HYS20_11075 [Rhodocyclales bacterium]|nr:hypothetical protein [Rhodocyclales bacterium]